MKHSAWPWKLKDGNIYTKNNEYIIRNGQADFSTMSPHREEQNANLILIAAAPDMREALEAINALLSGEWDSPALLKYGELSTNQADDISRIVSEAIQKAEGKL
jgi:hypothetical protein